MKKIIILLFSVISVLSAEQNISLNITKSDKVNITIFTLNGRVIEKYNDINVNSLTLLEDRAYQLYLMHTSINGVSNIQKIFPNTNLLLQTKISPSNNQVENKDSIETVNLIELTNIIPLNVSLSKVTNFRYINGIRTPFKKALNSSKRLNSSIENWCAFNHTDSIWNQEYNFDIIHNDPDGTEIDLTESFLQKAKEIGFTEADKNFTWFFFKKKLIENLLVLDTIDVEQLWENEIRAQHPNITRSKFKDLMGDYKKSFFEEVMKKSHQTLAGTTEKIKDSLISDFNSNAFDSTRTLVVAHSQGNLYLNDILTHPEMSEYRPYFGIIHLASVSRFQNGWWWTNQSDKVVNRVRALDDQIYGGLDDDRPGKKNRGAWASADELHHDMLLSYLNEDLISYDSILNAIVDIDANTPFYVNANTRAAFHKVDLANDLNESESKYTREPHELVPARATRSLTVNAHKYDDYNSFTDSVPSGNDSAVNHDGTIIPFNTNTVWVMSSPMWNRPLGLHDSVKLNFDINDNSYSTIYLGHMLPGTFTPQTPDEAIATIKVHFHDTTAVWSKNLILGVHVAWADIPTFVQPADPGTVIMKAWEKMDNYTLMTELPLPQALTAKRIKSISVIAPTIDYANATFLLTGITLKESDN